MPRPMHRLALSLLVAVPAALGACWNASAAAAANRPPHHFAVAAFGAVDPLAHVEELAAIGFDAVEPALSRLASLPDAELAALRTRLAAAGLAVRSANWFLPPDLAVTGPAVDDERVQRYLDRAIPVARDFGVRTIVFGSPKSRSFPDGFPRERAHAQLVAFLRRCDATIAAHGGGIVVGIEALRRPETNLVNTLAEATALAREVDRRHVRGIVDFYHLAYEGEDVAQVLAARDWIVHVQLAEPNARAFPSGDAAAAPYAAWFAALRAIDYRGVISIEAESRDVRGDAERALALLRAATAPR
jgi:D-psicose/D-tagatose/L-ribulose 3-epimerase